MTARRRLRVAVIVVVATLAVVAAATVVVVRGSAAPERAEATTDVTTVPVATGSMVSATNARGTLHYAREAPLVAGPGGVVTALPAPGTVVVPGAALYRVDDRPVVLLRGPLPAWRPFETGMTPGDDVRQLEQNLAAFGVFRDTPDTTFARATADAVRAWQKAVGVERTGRIERAAILFADHDLRVTATTAALGAEVAPGAELYRVSATDKVVDLDLRLGDQQLAVVGAAVGITLPDGATTTGSIASVGEPVERAADPAATDAAGAGTFVVPVTVALADQAAVAAFPRASVSVQFSSTLAEGVHTVPVEALVAVDASSFAVETPATTGDAGVRRIPVTLGAFASGRVQVTGDGITEGLPVVVPAS